MMLLAFIGVFYLSPILDQPSAFPHSYVPALFSYATQGASAIYDMHPDGTLTRPYALVCVPADLGLPNASYFRLPMKSLDEPMNLTGPQWTVLRAELDAKGIPTATLTASTPLRDVLVSIAQHHDPRFRATQLAEMCR